MANGSEWMTVVSLKEGFSSIFMVGWVVGEAISVRSFLASTD